MVVVDRSREETLAAALNGYSRGNRKSRESLWYILADGADVHLVTQIVEIDGVINCSVPRLNINSESGAIPVFTDMNLLKSWVQQNDINSFEVVDLKGVSLCENALIEELTILFNPDSNVECLFTSYDSQMVIEESEKIAFEGPVSRMNTNTMAFDPLDLVTPEGLRKASMSGNRSF